VHFPFTDVNAKKGDNIALSFVCLMDMDDSDETLLLKLYKKKKKKKRRRNQAVFRRY
jgi:hypothetical protein